MVAAKKNSGLGKGLEALFGEAENPVPVNDSGEGSASKGTESISIDDIKPNANQPRKQFSAETIADLAASIEKHGIIQPIIVRKAKAGYEIVAGERRWRAAREAGLKEVPCIIRELTEEQNMLFAIIENMQREDLNPIEEAEGLNKMMSLYSMTQEQVSKNVGKSRPYIANSLRLLKLPKEIREMVETGELTAGHGRALLAFPDEAKIRAVAERIVKKNLSVREVEELSAGGKPPKERKAQTKSTDVLQAEGDMKNALGTKVTIRDKGKKGVIEIEYYSREELDRLIEILSRA